MATATNPLEGIQQDADGNYFDVVDLGDGSGKQVFKGKTVAEVLGQYRQAQVHATRKIRELNQQAKLSVVPDPAVDIPEYRPHQPTADELWQLSEDLKDPTKVQAAMRRAMTWEMGASPEDVRANLSRQRANEMRQQIFAAGEAFMDAHPEYKRCQENEEAIFKYLDNNKLAYTRKNFEIAFEAMKSGLILLAPKQETAAPATQEDGPRIEQPPVVTRPRMASTGLTPRSSSTVPPSSSAPVRPKGFPTAEEIDAMPTAEYERRLRDSQWAAQAEKVLEAAAKSRR
jgi:hypothetical protein